MARQIKFKVWLSTIQKMTHTHFLEDMPKIFRELDSSDIALQYTGLNDKHGREIYEGDIVHVSTLDFGNMLVKFHRGAFLFYRHEQGKGVRGYRAHYYDESEIIGNIYENPELWGVERELEKII